MASLCLSVAASSTLSVTFVPLLSTHCCWQYSSLVQVVRFPPRHSQLFLLNREADKHTDKQGEAHLHFWYDTRKGRKELSLSHPRVVYPPRPVWFL